MASMSASSRNSSRLFAASRASTIGGSGACEFTPSASWRLAHGAPHSEAAMAQESCRRCSSRWAMFHGGNSSMRLIGWAAMRSLPPAVFRPRVRADAFALACAGRCFQAASAVAPASATRCLVWPAARPSDRAPISWPAAPDTSISMGTAAAGGPGTVGIAGTEACSIYTGNRTGTRSLNPCSAQHPAKQLTGADTVGRLACPRCGMSAFLQGGRSLACSACLNGAVRPRLGSSATHRAHVPDRLEPAYR